MKIGAQLLVIPGRGRIGGNEQLERKVVCLQEADRLNIEHGGNEDDAVEGDALVHQMSGQPGSTGGAVALSGQEQRRGPSLIARQIKADEFADGFDIAFEAPEFLVQLLFGRSTETGADRIDEHQICLIEPRVLIVLISERWRRHPAFRLHHHAFGS